MDTIRKDVFELYVVEKLRKANSNIEFYKQDESYKQHLAFWQGVKSELESIRAAFGKSVSERDEMFNSY